MQAHPLQAAPQNLLIRELGQQDYKTCWQAMQDFTNQRQETTTDECWLVEHPPVYTLGQSGKAEHILKRNSIPLVQSDRGGQVTYHGPGQLVVYTLFDLKRLKLSIRQLVTGLEQTLIHYLASEGLTAKARCEAPGVYIEHRKIASIGLRVRRGYAFHGLAFNIAMDLEPFSAINPCGYAGLEMTQLSAFKPQATLETTKKPLVHSLIQQFGYSELS